MRTIPTIRTARVTLRGMRAQDFDRYADIWSNTDVVRYVGGQPWDETRAWASFLRNAGHWQMTGFGQWAVEVHGNRNMVGQVGFFCARAGVGEDFDAWPEAGWLLHPEVQGIGVGRDACIAAHDWFDRVITGPLVCKIAPENDRSMRVAHSLGYAVLRDVSIEGDDVRLMIRRAPPQGLLQ